MIYRKNLLICSVLLLAFWGTANATNNEVLLLQHEWAHIQYQMPEDGREKALLALSKRAEQLTEKEPRCAECWIWAGIIRSSYAGAKGGLGALGEAKKARTYLERALTIDPAAQDGSAYTSLGTLYYQVPGWPIGFGNDKKAETMLKKALEYNPNGIDPNYFWGDYLMRHKRYREALAAFHKAAQAADRPNRPLADAGRRKEIQAAIIKAEKALH